MNSHNYLIIGAGIVGLSTAYNIQLLDPSASVIVLEKESDVAAHQTSHNSGVIHSGVYYKPGSAKAFNCTRGYKMLIDFCEQYQVNYKITGKVIVATSEKELPSLQTIYAKGTQNGLQGLKMLSTSELLAKEPHCNGLQAIWVPQAGIIDYKEVALKHKQIILSKGGVLKNNETVHSIKKDGDTWRVTTTQSEYKANTVISCAGLHADRIARMTHPDFDLQILPFRGEYYYLKPQAYHLVKTLIYPVPNPHFPFLGVHFTSTIHGGVEAGPNAVWALGREAYKGAPINSKDSLETLAYPGFRKLAIKYWRDGINEMVRSWSKAAFVKGLQRLVPEITSGDLQTGGSGVRAQACDRKGNLIDDFLFLEAKNLLHVINAPSPAATSNLSIGKTIADKVVKR